MTDGEPFHHDLRPGKTDYECLPTQDAFIKDQHTKITGFPSDDAAMKRIWLARRNITADLGRAVRNWKEAMNQFAILYEKRFVRVAGQLG